MENTKEEFRDIPNYEGYQVSNLGRVKSLSRRKLDMLGRSQSVKEKILNLRPDKDGYLYLTLCKKSKAYTKKIHQLVAITFLNHVPNGFNIVVNHINFIKTDNRVENLELVTTRENTNKKHIKGSSVHIGVCWNKATSKWVSQIIISRDRVHLGLFSCELEASNIYKLAVSNLDKYTGNNKDFRDYLKSL